MTRKNVNSAHPNPNGEISSRRKYRSSTRNRTRLLYHRPVSRPSGRTTRRLLVSLAILAGAAVLAGDRPGAARWPLGRPQSFPRLSPSRPPLGDGGAGRAPAGRLQLVA